MSPLRYFIYRDQLYILLPRKIGGANGIIKNPINRNHNNGYYISPIWQTVITLPTTQQNTNTSRLSNYLPSKTSFMSHFTQKKTLTSGMVDTLNYRAPSMSRFCRSSSEEASLICRLNIENFFCKCHVMTF